MFAQQRRYLEKRYRAHDWQRRGARLGASSKASISMVRKFVIGRCIEHSAMKVRSRA